MCYFRTVRSKTGFSSTDHFLKEIKNKSLSVVKLKFYDEIKVMKLFARPPRNSLSWSSKDLHVFWLTTCVGLEPHNSVILDALIKYVTLMVVIFTLSSENFISIIKFKCYDHAPFFSVTFIKWFSFSKYSYFGKYRCDKVKIEIQIIISWNNYFLNIITQDNYFLIIITWNNYFNKLTLNM